MSEPADKPQRRRRHKLTRDERSQRAEYMRRYRATKAPIVDGAKSIPDNVDAPLPPAPLAASQAQVVPSAPPGLSLADKERLLSEALAGTSEALADTAQLIWLDSKAPHLGRERSKTLGALWAPILAPYIDEDIAKWLPLALAMGGTTNAFYQWAHEYRAYRDSTQLHVIHDKVKLHEVA